MEQKSYIKSLKSALRILDSFTHDNNEQGVTEIASKLDMNKSKVSRIVSTLAVDKILVKSQNSRKYRLGPKILQLASVVYSEAYLRAITLPYLEQLRKETGETVGIYVLEEDHRVCLDRLESPHGVRVGMNVGEHLALYAGAAGKLLLAYLPREQRKQLIDNIELSKLTPYTITNKEKLKKELMRIRKQGFSVSFQERTPLAASLAVPIRDYTGGVVAALGVSGPAMRLTRIKVKQCIWIAETMADEISRQLGYQEKRTFPDK